MKSIAFYLPQFHPIPENDEWWGTGFTEWRNVVRARPRFRGHYQPHLPADLGFYDLRLPETRAAQAALAQQYGIDGFCYYHYWFNGRRLLEAPLQRVLESGEPDFPFMLCWANENWTRRWDGSDEQVLLGQAYSPEDDLDHIRALVPVFTDPRYIRVDDKPAFLVYKASELPDPAATTRRWREEYRRLTGGELLLCRVEAHDADRGDPRLLGFDAAVEFQPDAPNLPPRIGHTLPARVLRRLLRPRSGYRHNLVYDYDEVVARALAKDRPGHPLFRGVTPSWDNSARRARQARIIRSSTPERFEQWVREAASKTTPGTLEHEFLFVNAWNEWAEGNHLEPDMRFGTAYLEAHRAGRQAAG